MTALIEYLTVLLEYIDPISRVAIEQQLTRKVRGIPFKSHLSALDQLLHCLIAGEGHSDGTFFFAKSAILSQVCCILWKLGKYSSIQVVLRLMINHSS